MKILFVCGSLNEGKDGIGDYLRQFSSSLSKLGLTCYCLSMNDVKDDYDSMQWQNIPADKVSSPLFIRLSKSMNMKSKADFIEKLLLEIKPNVVSFQFVIYWMHSRGWIYEFNRIMAPKFRGYNVHIMWHELWIGQLRTSSILNRIEGSIQRKFIFDFLEIVNPKLHTTTIPFYQALLDFNGIKASILPLFSNFSLERDKNFDFINLIGENKNEIKSIIFVCFGTIFTDFPFQHWLKEAEKWHLKTRRNIVFCSLGKQGRGEATWGNWKEKVSKFDWINLVELGPLTPAQIQQSFALSDVGVCLTPLEGIGKSSSVTVMIENGLTIMGYEFGISPSRLNFKSSFPREILGYSLSVENTWPTTFEKHAPKTTLDIVSNQFVKYLEKFNE